MDKYKDSSLKIADRVQDLIKRMTLDEKIGQMQCFFLINPDDPKLEMALKNGIGHVSAVNAGGTPEEICMRINKIQKKSIESTRLGIPVLFHSEALSGPVVPGAAKFPLPITLASSFDGKLVKDLATITREQMLSMGIRLSLSPVMDIARDFRYGRTGETFGSDCNLVSEMTTAFVQGLQGENPDEGIAAVAKHFLGCAQPEAGINQTRALIDNRELDEVIAKPFESAINRADLKGVMNSYGEHNGEPFVGSRGYMNNYLRDTLGFKGVTFSDYHSLERLIEPFHMANDKENAAKLAVDAGMDVEFPAPEIYAALKTAIEKGMIDEKELDKSIERILTLKFELGLFDNPYAVFNKEVFDKEYYSKLEKKAVEESVILLKNDGILPIRQNKIKIGLVGQSANSVRHFFGAYTEPGTMEMMMRLLSDSSAIGMAGVKVDADKKSEKVTLDKINNIIKAGNPECLTIKEALTDMVPELMYADGFNIGGDEQEPDMEQAKRVAEESDILIICVGGKNGVGKECTSGEGVDTTRIELAGQQEKCLQMLFEINPNSIVVHMDSRPLVSQFIYQNARAIIEAWLPGISGGKVIADVIMGKLNPSGHLAVDIPVSTGQTPYYYGQRRGSSMASIRQCKGDFVVNQEGYIDERREAQLPFGYGLSYTEFKYTNMTCRVTECLDYEISVEVTNTGKMAGADVVQLYGSDTVSSVIRPMKELFGAQRVELEAGDTSKIVFKGNLDQFAFSQNGGQYVIEAGEYCFEIAEDCEKTVLTSKYILEKDVAVKRNNRTFYAKSYTIREN